MTRKISRRDFLKLMGAGTIVLGFGGLGGFAGLFGKQKSYGSGQPIMNYVDPVSTLATSGKWEILQHSVNGVLKDNICPVMPEHAALLRNGHVLFLAGSQNDHQGYNHHCQIYWNFIWDFDNGYQNSTFRVKATPTDVFCGGHSFLSDGSLLIAGGTKELSALTGLPGGLGFQGTPDSYLFEPLSESFPEAQHRKMRDGRWYPTLITLGSGRILTVTGLSAVLTAAGGQQDNRLTEVYSRSNGWMSPLTFIVSGKEKFIDCDTGQPFSSNITSLGVPWPLYPHLTLLADGRVFYSGGHVFKERFCLQPGWIQLDSGPSTYNYTRLANLPSDFNLRLRDHSCTVLLPPAQDQKVMIIGGGDHGGMYNAINNVHIINLSDSNPTYVSTGSLNHARLHHSAILLPDRTVLVCNGNLRGDNPTPPEKEAEIYNPVTGIWTVVATAAVPRNYHSLGLLLPDGRVATAGSNPAGPAPGKSGKPNQDIDPTSTTFQQPIPPRNWDPKTGTGDACNIPPTPNRPDELRLEIFHPPYLFNGPRPVIQDVEQEITYGQQIHIISPDANSIHWVHIIRPMAITHSMDTEQRLVDLPISQRGLHSVTAVVTDNPNLAPPGWYMLFIVRPLSETAIPRGVPSTARWVHLTPRQLTVDRVPTSPGGIPLEA